MSCFDNDSTKPKIKTFINDLNAFLRENEVSIDFTSGTLFLNKYGYCGILDDTRDNILLVEDVDGNVIYESKQIAN
jgi:hypothetical protein